MHSLLRVLEHHAVSDAAAKALVIALLFVAASLVARLASVSRVPSSRGAPPTTTSARSSR
jgi:hypothetical protein